MRVYVGRVRELAERFPLGASIALVELERYDNSALLARLSENEPVTWFAFACVCRRGVYEVARATRWSREPSLISSRSALSR